MKLPLKRKCSEARSSAATGEDVCRGAEPYAVEPLEPRLLLAADLGAGLDVASAWSAEAQQRGLVAEAFDEAAATRLGDLGRDLSPLAGAIRQGIAEAPLAPLDLAQLHGLLTGASTPAGSQSSTAAAVQNSPLDAVAVRHEVVFVDAGVDGHEALLADLGLHQDSARQVDVYLLDAEIDGVARIGAVLGGYQDLDAVHIVSHGDAGVLQLGSTWLDGAGMHANANALAGWGEALSADADLLIYGCDLAATVEGEQFVGALAWLTGADVAASDDLTGNIAQGGDWDLEYRQGAIETAIAFEVETAQRWSGVLAAPVNAVPATQATNEDTSLVLSSGNGNVVSVSDADGGSTEVTLTVTNGTVTLSNTIGPEFLVNTTTSQEQVEPVIAMAADDSYVIAWASKGQDDLDGKVGIFFQRYAADGTTLGAEILANQTTLDDQKLPAIAMDAAGKFVISWVSKAQDDVDGSEGVYARVFNADGTAASNEFQVNQTTLDHQNAPAVSMDNAGNFAIAWVSKAQDDIDGKGGIYARLFNAAGNPATGEFLVNQTTPEEQLAPSIAMDADGDFVVAWQSKGQDGDKEGIYARQFDASGTAQTGEFLVNQTTINEQFAPSVASDDAGNFVIAWQSKDQDFVDGKAGIVARLYDNTATAQGNEFVVNSTVAGDQKLPVVTMNAGGEFVVAWETKNHDYPDNKLGIYAQYFDATGTAQGEEFLVNQTTPLDQKAPSLALNSLGEAIAVWQSKDHDGDKEGVYGQRFLPPNGLTFTSGDGIDDSLVTFSGSLDAVNGALDGLVFTPTSDFYGTANIQIDSDDGTNTDTDDFDITVNPVNDAPANSIPGPQTTVESTPLTFSTGNGNAVSIVDDAGANPVKVTLTATNGNISLSGTGGLSFTTGDGSGDTAMVFTGTLADINAALEGLTFTPLAGFAGNAYLRIATDDQGNTGGGALTDSDTITVTVTPDASNDAPVIAVPGGQSTPQDTTLLFSDANGNPVTLTDDADGNPVQLTLTVTNGTVTLSPHINSESLVNTNTVEDQLNSQVAVAADGSYIVVWEGKVQDDPDGKAGIFAQRYNPLGEAEGAEFQVNTFTVGDQKEAAVAINASGAFVVVWQSANQDGAGAGIYGQLFDTGGNRVGGEFEINTTIADDQDTPSVAMDDAGNFVVTWTSKGQDNLDLKTGIYAQRYDATGVAQGAEFLVNTETLSDQNIPAIAMDSDGDFVIVWQSKDQDGDRVGIYGQRFNAGGVAQGVEFQVNTETLQDQLAPAVAMDDAGNFVVAWQSKDQDGDGVGIYAQRYAANGATQGIEFRVNSTTTDDQLAPSIAMQGSGEFIVAWQSKGQDNVDNKLGVYAQRYDAGGVAQGSEALVNTTTLDDQQLPSVALDEKGNAIVSWTSTNQDNVDGKDGVYLQRLPGADAITYLIGDGVDDASIVLTGTVAQINQALDGMTFTPTLGFNGTAGVQVDVDDLGNSGTGGALTDSDNLFITVGTPDVTAPFLVNNTGSTLAEGATDTLGNIELRYDDAGQPAAAVTYTVTTAPVNGQLELTSNPGVAITSFTQAQVDASQVVYVHDGNEAVADSFDFDVDDGSFNTLTGQSFSLTITPVNDAPVNNVPGQQNTDTDTALVFDAVNGNLISISDDAGIGAIEVALNATNGLITLSGTTGLSFTLGDGGDDLDMTFTGTLADVNAALDGLIFDPDTAFTGTATLQIATDDQGNTGGGALSDTDLINIEVGNYNSAPAITAPLSQGTVEDTALVFSTGNANAISVADADAAGDDIRVTLAVSNGTLTLGSVLGLNFSQGDGSDDPMMVFEGTVAEINSALEGLSFDPVANYAGPAVLQMTVNDLGNNGPGGAQVDATVIDIDITPDATNDPPTLGMPGPQTTPEDTPLHLVSSTGNLIQVDDDSAVQVFDDAVLTPIEITISATGGTVSLGEVLGSEFAVNTHTADHQTDPVVASAANGDYVVVWASNNQDGNGYGIYGQRFSVNGLPLGGEFRVHSDIVSHQIEPAVAMADDGSFVVAWTGKDTDGTGVFGQRFGATGARLGSEFRINTEAVKDQATPALAMDAAGNFVVVWHSDDQDGDGSGIYGQRYDNAGATVGAEFSINTETAKDQSAPAVAMDADGDFVVVWQSDDQDTDKWGIYGQRFDSGGTAQGGEFLINSRTLKEQLAPSVAMDDSGNFVVAWQSLQQDNLDKRFGVYAQRYDAAGSTLGAEFLVNTTTLQAQTAPSISMDGSGEFVIVWQSDDQDGDQEGIYGQRYAADGSTINDEFKINTVTAKAQTAPSVAMSDSGTFVAVWSSDDQDGSNTGVYGQRFKTSWNQTFTVGDGIDDVTMTFSATVAEINDLLGGLVFIPASGYSGAASLDVTLDDGANIVSASTPITVLPINDAPGVAVPGSQNVTEGQSLVFSVAGGNAVTLADIDALGNPVLVTLTGTGGALTLAGVTGLTFSTGDGTADPVMTFTGTLADINTALDGMSFTPLAGYTGPANLHVHLDDQGNTGAGGALSAGNTVYISVDPDPVNDAPVNNVPGPQETGKNVPLAFSTANGNAITITDDSGANAIEMTLTVTNGSISLSDGIGTEVAANSTTANDQSVSRIAVKPTGEFVVVWQSNNQDGDGNGIYGQWFNAFGQAEGPEFQVNATTAKHQTVPVVAMDTAGNFVVAWQSEDQDGDNMGIVLQRFGAGGARLGGELLVNTLVADAQISPAIAMADDGRFVVVWQSKNQDGDGEGVYGQLYADDGSAFGDEFLINTTTADDQVAPAVAMNAAGDFVVVWQSNNQDGDGQGIYGQRFDASGATVDSEFRINDTTSKDQIAPAVSLRDDGTFVVVWQSKDQDGDGQGIYAQAYDAAGLQVGLEFLVNTTTAKDQMAPQVSVNDDGEYVVVWQSTDQDGDGEGVYGQVFDAAGTLIGDEFLINTNTSDDQTAPAVAADGTGNFVTTWTSKNQDGSGQGVYAQRHLDPQGLNYLTGDGTDDALIVVRGTVQALNAALGGLVFTPDLNFEGAASIRLQVDDLGNTGFGGALSADDTIDIMVHGGPIVDLDADDSSGAVGSAFQADFIWTGASAPVLVADADGFFSDPNDNNLQSLTVTLTNRPDGASEGLTADVSGTSLVLTAYNPATGILTLTGNRPIAEYEQVLRTIAYDNTDADPDESQRIITFVANDGDYDSNVATTYLTVSGPNDAPVATVPGAQVTLEDTSLVFSTGNANAISIGDEDAGDNDLQVTLSTAGGALTLGTTDRLASVVGNGTGNVVLSGTVNVINNALEGLQFDPTAHLAGATSIGILVDDLGNTGDGGALTDSESIAVTITPVNDEPALSPLSDQVVDEDAAAQTVAGFATPAPAGGADEAGQTFSYNLSNDNAGLFSVGPAIDASGTLTYTLAADAHGTATLTVSVTDSGGTANGGDDTSPDRTFDITANPVADTPSVTDANTNEDTLSSGGLVLSRNAVDGAEVTHFKITNITGGTLYQTDGVTVINSGDFISFAEGSAGLRFDPTADSVTTGHFDAQAATTNDNTGLGGGVVTADITINPVNDAPVLGAVGDQSVDELATLSFTATATDADLPADTLTFSLDAGSIALGMSIDANSGAFSWTPTEGQGGLTPSVTVTVTDDGTGNLVDSETFTITVNDVNVAPVLGAIGDQSVDELATLSFTATATDSDLPADTLAFSLDAGSIALGMSIDANTGAFSWTPTEGQGGLTPSVTVTVTDDGTGNLVDSETFTITVNDVNVAPVLGAIGDQSIDELATLSFTATATDSDLPADTLTFSLDAGSIALGMSIDANTGAFSWTPTEGQGGLTPSVTVTVTDDGTGNLIDSETFTITVNDVNVAPVLGAIGDQSIDELATLSFTATATDSDLPADTLTFSLDAGSIALGMSIDANSGAFSWTPTEGQGGLTPSVTVTVTDDGTGNLVDSETFTITVNDLNTAPVLGAIGDRSVDELATLSFTATATDSDLPADTLTFSLDAGSIALGMSIDANTGAFSWTPTESQGGLTPSVTVTVTDDGTGNLVDSETFTITVNDVNVAPVLGAIGDRSVDELATLSFTATATDSDLPADTLTFSLDAGSIALGMSIDANTGAFSWTPTEGQGGLTPSVTVTVTDDGTGNLIDSETFTITVNDVNVAPVLGAIGDQSIDELATLSFTATATDSDLPADTLTFSLDAGSIALGMSIDANTGAFSWTPTEGQGSLTPSVTVTVTDDGTGNLVDSETFTITVNDVNVAPVLGAIGDQSVDELATLSFTATATDSDLPADILAFSLDAGSIALGMSIDANTGAFSWTPTEGQGGLTPSVTVTVTDDGTGNLVDSETFTITVNDVNVAPVLGAIGDQSIDELATLSFTATATDSDLPADTLAFSLDAGSIALGMSIDANTGAFSWTPTESQGGLTPSVTVTVTDDGTGNLVDSETFTITVNDLNTAPVLGAIGDRSVDELATLSFTATATDADLPADTLTFSLDAGSIALGMSIDANTGAFSWTPSEGQGGLTPSVTVTVTDDGTGNLVDSETFTITVNDVNVAPVLGAIGDQTVDELATLSFTATATDADLPADTLTFSLDAGSIALGMSIDANSGAFSWTPTEGQGGLTPSVTVTVTDDGTGNLVDSETFTITVNDVNVAPVLGAIGDQSVDELATLSFTATATDSDLPADTLTFSLDAGSIALGMSIDANSGAFSWTPTEGQGGLTPSVTVTVTDDGTGNLIDSETFTITVNDVNVAPVLGAIGDQSVDELATLSFTATATDADLPADTLAFSLDAGSIALGMSIDANTGAFSWTPTEGQGGLTPSVTVTVTDDGTGNLVDSETFTITVNDVNVAPVLGAIGDQSIDELATLSFAATATDSDLPADTLAFSLDAGSIALGMSIDANTGAFSWTPTEGQGGLTPSVTVTVTDDGTGNLVDSETFTITVNDLNTAPVLGAIGDQSIDELATLSFTATATDSDLPADTLAFSLDAGSIALGMSIDANTGAFSWTPTEGQGGLTPSVTVTVTDDGTGNLVDSETFTITVNDVNVAPVLGAIGDQSVDELATLSFTTTATDSDLPADTLTFSLDAGSIALGMSIDANSGAFSWTPTEGQGGLTPSVTVTVTDSGTGNLVDFETFTITVNDVNVAPVLGAIGDQSIDELATLSFTATATDSDLPADTLTFSLDAGSIALGMSIDANTGAFSWTPTEGQGGLTPSVTVTVTDDGTGNLIDSETFTITVNDVNVAPVLGAIGDQSIDELATLSFTATATDSDLPADTLAFSLDAGSIALGMSIDANTGAFSWTPTEGQGGLTPSVTVTVTDDGTGNLIDSETFTITVNDVNVAPVLGAIGDQSVDELATLSFTATATDSDLPADTLTFSLDAGSIALGMSIDANTGAFSWTPTEGQGGLTPSVTVTVTDDGTGNLVDSETFTITVNDVNVAPVLGAIGDQSIDELATLSFTATATDADLPADTLTFSLDAGSIALGMSIDANTGAFSWTPTEGQGGLTPSVTVTVTDDGTGNLIDSETFTITVNDVNVAPVLGAIGDQSIDELATLSFTATATDSDLPADTLTFSLDAGSIALGMSIDANTGAFSWTPTEGQGGLTPSVTVTVTDDGTGNLVDSETFTIMVNDVNVAPVLGAIGDRSVDELATLSFTATATDSDLPADTLTFSLDAGSIALGMSIDANTGAFSWTPTEGQGGLTPSVTVSVTDDGTGNLVDSETFTITVNDVNVAPVLGAIGDQSVDELATLSFTATATDSDLPADTLTFSLDAGSIALGMSIDANTGAFSWTPTEGQGGLTPSVTVTVTDDGTGNLIDSETFTITVNDVNVAPVLGAIGDQSIDELATLSFTATATDSDLPADTLAFSLDAGSIALGMSIDANTGAFSWTPTEGQGGLTPSVTVTVTDDGTGNLIDSETFTITVNDVNVAPVLGAIGDQSVDELATLSFTATATDSDLPADTLTFSLDAGSIALGMSIDANTGAFSWTPTEGQGGLTPSVTVTVTDDGTGNLIDSETFTITVNDVNVAPVLGAIGDQSVDELATLSFTATATDSDLPADTLAFSLDAGSIALGMSIDANTGAFSWTPTEGQGGLTPSVTVTVTDDGTGNLIDSETFTITVNDVNVAPVLGAIGDRSVDELATLSFTATATDSDLPADTLAFSLDAGSIALGMSIDANTGAFSWTPTEGQGGLTPSVTVTVTDDGTGNLVDSETFTITVNDVNVAPVLGAIGDQSVDELATLSFTATATDSDLPADTLTFSLDAGSIALGMSIDANTGAFSWTPTEGQGGLTPSVTVTVTDDGTGNLVDSETFTITVNDVNVAPVLGAIGDQSIDELATLSFTATATDSDLPADTLTFSLDAGSIALGMSIDANSGAFSWTPTEGQGGLTPSVTVTVTDDGTGNLVDSETFTITVNDLNTAPVLGAIGDRSVDELATLSFTATATDSDLPADTLTFSLDAGSIALGMSIDANTGAFSWTPTESQGGLTPSVTVTVTDDGTGNLVDSETFTITVNDVNVAPVLGAIGDRSVDELATLSFTATATDSDLPADTLTFSLDAGSIALGMSIDANTGAFSWTPTEGQGGLTPSVTVTVTDDGTGNLIDSETFTITVNDLNSAPAITSAGGGGAAAVNAAENQASVTTVTASDADVPTDTLTYGISGGADAGLFSIDSVTGVLTFDSAPDYEAPVDADSNGVYEVEVQVSDGVAVDTQLISVTVTDANDAPTGLPSIIGTAEEDQVLIADSSGIGDADGLGVFSYQWLRNGSLISGATGSSHALGDADVGALISVEVRYTDGNGNDEGPLASAPTVPVANVNDLPTLTGVAKSGIEDVAVSFSASDFISAFSDLDGDSLTQIRVTSLPANGTLSLSGTAVALNDVIAVGQLGNLAFVPDADWNGVSGFDWRGYDGTAWSAVDASATITVNAVNDAPFGSDNTVAASEDTGHVFSVSDFGFSDAVDGDALMAVKVVTAPGAGTLLLNGVVLTGGETVSAADIAAGRLVFVSPADVNGLGFASFAFQLQDDGGTVNGGADLDPSPNLLTIDVAAVNDAPVNLGGLPGPISAEPGVPVDLDLSALLLDDVDAGASSLTLTLRTSAGGMLQALSWGGVSVSGSGTDILKLDGTLGALNAFVLVPAAVQYIGDADLAGLSGDTLIVTIDDNGNTGVGSGQTVLGQVAVHGPSAPVDSGSPGTTFEPPPPVEPTVTPVVASTTDPVGTPGVEDKAGEPPRAATDVEEDASSPTLRDMLADRGAGPSDVEIEQLDNSNGKSPSGASMHAMLEALLNSAIELKVPAAMLADPVKLLSESLGFRDALDAMHRDLVEETAYFDDAVRSSAVLAAGLSVGYVAWLAKGGMMAASLVATLPAWRLFDPIPILANMDDEDDPDEESESLASIVDGEQERADAVANHVAADAKTPAGARDTTS